MVPSQIYNGLNEDKQAIYHVFFGILKMDKAQLLQWLSYHGINSMDELVMCYSSFDPSYKINGNTLYLDSWIYENLSSVCKLFYQVRSTQRTPRE